MKKQVSMMFVVLGLAASPLLAHGGPHLKGTVAAIAPDQIAVKEAGGHESAAKITPQTRFLRGKAAGKREDLHQGDRVVVHTRKSGDALEAVEVHYAAAQKAP
jgi:hypothetical protein